MRRRPAVWIVLGILLLIAVSMGWRFFEGRGQKGEARGQAKKLHASNSNVKNQTANGQNSTSNVQNQAKLPSAEAVARAERILADKANKLEKFKNRLSNTTATAGELTRKDHAILLRNALFDTEKPVTPNIPNHLRSPDDPGSYIVQSKTAIDKTFRDALTQAGAAIVPNTYIPNNALMVRASKDVAQQLATLPQTQTVLPFEPYYKLQTGLLDEAVNQRPLPEGSILNVLLYTDKKDATISELNKLGAQVLADEPNYFGHVVKLVAPENWTELARLPGVQLVEVSHSRVSANDLSRVAIGVATDTTNDANYLNLTGDNVMVAVNDTGVDTNHPDLAGRVFGDFSSSLVDSNGHGTHVAGIIASSGDSSTTVTNVSGSLSPGTNHQYRGIAPQAKIFSMSVDSSFRTVGSETSFGPLTSNTHLQEAAARTNALISNNSWHYFRDFDYDLAAASYDAAVRDSLPGVTGSQALTYVFAAGNAGGGDDSGQNGGGGTILSPATAKNVITVGAIEQNRLITNQVSTPTGALDTNNQPIFSTNTPWIGMTDSSNQVARFSSRGNVGIGTEGDFGRFKPDVVAPGTFVVSTTVQADWDQVSYYDPTNYDLQFPFGTVETNTLDLHSIFIPFNAVRVVISVEPNTLPIYVSSSGFPDTNSPSRIGTFQIGGPTPDLPLSVTDTDWFYAIGNPSNAPIDYVVQLLIVTTNNAGNYFDVLKGLNTNCGPFYRYESGTSMAAADVSGTLALMQQYFQQLPQPQTNSPALMKALLVNGARTLGGAYDFLVTNVLDLQGWGLINLPASLQTNINIEGQSVNTGKSMLIFDQHPTNALATGQSRTYHVQLSDAAQDNALRVTLAWTDPPGNPFVGAKLVNNLDLIVTNTDDPTNPIIYLGNDIPASGQFNVQWDTNSAPNFDAINNVENVYLFPGSGKDFDVTVIAKSVNVNAVTGQTNEVEQDYALVISSGDGDLPDAITLLPRVPDTFALIPQVTTLSNQFDNLQPPEGGDPIIGGGALDHQRVGASFQIPGTNTLPLALGTLGGNGVNGQISLGTTNGWHFYVVTNTHGFTNAAFLLDVAIPTSISPVVTNFTRTEADVDLYVSTNPALTNLDPIVIAAADKSLDRGGTETVILTNAVEGLYYVGVKSEDQEAAEYSFVALFSLNPFSDEDQNGQLVRGLNVPAIIPDGTPQRAGVADIYGLAVSKMTAKRIIVTNVLTHELTGDLFSTLRHTLLSSVVNNHSGSSGVTNQVFMYDDSGRRDIVGSQHTDIPGNLSIFNGIPAQGQWHFLMQDNAPTHTGTNLDFKMYIEKQKDLTDGILVPLPPGGCDSEYIFVAPEDTNLTVITAITAGSGPVGVQICPLGASGNDCVTTNLFIAATNVIDKSSDPPLNSGTYVITLCNNSSSDVTVFLRAFTIPDVNGVIPSTFSGNQQSVIADDAVTYSTARVASSSRQDPLRIVRAEVGVRIDHPRISDLVLSLISPDGTRMLLDQNRGGSDTNGMGSSINSTNIVPVDSNGGFEAQTNIIDMGFAPAFFRVDWDFFQVPDVIHIYYGGNLVFNSGLVSGTGTFQTNFPGPSTVVTIIMNEGGNANKGTAWTYTVTASQANYNYVTFTEDTNKTITPIKFAIPPFNHAAALSTAVTNYEFETPVVAPSQDFAVGTSFDVWQVVSNSVTLTNDSARSLPLSPNQYVLLHKGGLHTTLPTQGGKGYTLTFWYRLDKPLDIDGSFEDFPPETTIFNNSIGGWTVTDIDSVGPHWPAAQGNISLDLNGNGTGLIFRSVATELNQPYLLQFAHAGNPDLGPALTNVEMQVGWRGGTVKTIDWDPSTHTDTDLGWVYTNLTVIGSGGVDELRFESTTSGSWGPTLDDVSMYLLGRAEASVGGRSPIIVTGATNWQQASIAFTALGTNTSFDIQGLDDGLIIDSVVLTEAGGPYYVLPEDPYGLGSLVGKSAIGDWQLEVWDNRVGPPIPGNTNANAPRLLSWQLSFIFATPKPLPIDLTDNTTNVNTVKPGQVRYFTVQVPSWASGATNDLIFATGPGVSVLFNQSGLPLTGVGTDVPELGPGAVNGSFSFDLSSSPALVPGSTYYLAVTNSGATTVNFALKVNFNVTPLTLNVPIITAATTNANVPRYFSYDVTNGETAVTFALTNLNGNVDLVASHTLPFPTPGFSDYGSFNPTTNDEEIIVFSNSDPVPLGPGHWYLGVFNSTSPLTNVAYTIVVTDQTNPVPNIIELFNGIPYANSNAGVPGFDVDYYRYVVSSNGVRVQFEITNATGPIALYAHRGLPLPPGSFDYKTGAATNDVITIFTNSTPVPLGPGDWFISAANSNSGPVNYTIVAMEWAFTGRPLVITNEFHTTSNSFCITWTSLPGVQYWVGGRTNILQPGWDNVSGTVTATGYSTTWCLPLPSPYQFFRVFEGFPPGSAATASLIAAPAPKIVANGNAFTVNWTGPSNGQYKVQWTTSLSSPNWQPFPGTITSSSGTYTFTDNGSQTSGLGKSRFYRIVKQ